MSGLYPLLKHIPWTLRSPALAFVLMPGWALAQPPVEVAAVGMQTVTEEIQLTGSVTSLRSARLSASTAGQVHTLAVDAGSAVTAGDVLLVLDEELADWQHRAATAAVEAAELALADARRRRDEAQALAPKQSIAESLLRDLEAEVASDAADLRRAEAEAGYRAALLERHRVTAPFDGAISAKLTEIGEWVTPGQAVLEVVATEALRLEFPIAEHQRSAVTVGATLRYRLSDSAQAKTATITTLVPVADPGARTFTLHAEPRDKDPGMAPGMSVRALLALDKGAPRLVVPRDAVLSFADGRTLAWIAEAGPDGVVAREREITVAQASGNRVEVISGLSAGMQVIVKGNESLRDGQSVRIIDTGDR